MKIDAPTLRTIAAMSPKSIPPMLLILAGQLEQEEARLSGQRERTRKHRERNVTVTSLVTPQERDSKVTTLSPSKEIPPTPPKETQPLSRTTDDSAREVSKLEEGELFATAGGSLGSSPNLFVMAEPMRWKAAGMDWLGDIIPAIRTAAVKCRPGSVQSWNYFSQAIADWHEARTKPMPKGATGNARSKLTTADFARQLSREARERERDDGDPVAPVVILPGEGERRRQQA